MGKRKIPDRTQYENELVRLLMSEKTKWFATTSGNNKGWDVTLMQGGKGIWLNSVQFEVKTSVRPKVYLTSHQRTKKQLAWYRRLYRDYGIVTWYAFRKMGGPGNPSEKERWRFFHVRSLSKALIWEEGLTYREMMKKLKR